MFGDVKEAAKEPKICEEHKRRDVLEHANGDGDILNGRVDVPRAGWFGRHDGRAAGWAISGIKIARRARRPPAAALLFGRVGADRLGRLRHLASVDGLGRFVREGLVVRERR